MLDATVRERCLIYLLDRAEVKEHDPAAARQVQDSIGSAMHTRRSQVSRAMKALCAQGLVRMAKIHSKGESRKRFAYFLTEKGLGTAKNLRLRLEQAVVTLVDVEGRESEHTLGEIPALLPRPFRFSDLVANVHNGKLDARGIMEWHGRRHAGKVYDVVEAVESPHFVGRVDVLADLDRFLGDEKLRVFSLAGLPGIGKTAAGSKWVSGLKGRTNVFWRRIHKDTKAGDLLRDLAIMLLSAGRPALSNYLEREHGGALEMPTEILRQSFSGLRVLLIFDDAHVASREVNRLLKGLTGLDETVANPKILLLSREKSDFLTAEDVVLGRAREQELPSLSKAEADRLLTALGVAPGLRESIWKKCGGHPLSLEIAARSMMPLDSLEHVSAQRITQEVLGKLDEDTRDTLAFASVFNRPVPLGTLGKNAEVLMQMCLLRRHGDGFIGVHDLVKVAALQGLEHDEIASLHLKAGSLLARSQSRDDILEAIHHLVLAEDWDEAMSLAEEHGQDLIGAGLAENLLPLLQQLSSVSRGEARAPRMNLYQGHALFAMGQWPEAGRVYERCSTSADQNVAAEAILGQGKVEVQRHSPSALRHLAIAQDRLERLGSLRLLAETQYWMGGWYEDSGHLNSARDAYEHGRAIAFDIGDRKWEGLCTYGIGRVKHAKKDKDGAIREGKEALRLLELDGQRLEIAKVCTALGGYLLVAGKMIEAEAYASKAVKEAREIGALNVLVSGLYNLASIYQERGDSSMAVPLLEEAMNLYERIEKYDEAVWCAAWIAAEEWSKGNVGRWSDMTSQAERLLSRIAEPAMRVTSLRNLGGAAIKAGRREDAVRYLGRAINEAKAAKLDDFVEEITKLLGGLD